jgi:1,4-dihydroxy-2-naphthoate octaprenyltransferase
MSFKIYEPVRALQFLLSDPESLGGVIFSTGHAVNTESANYAAAWPQGSIAGTLVAISTAAGLVGNIVAWNPASADAGTAVLAGILAYSIEGDYTEDTVPASYVSLGPIRVRSSFGYLTYPGYGTLLGDSTATAALRTLQIIVRN